MFFFHQWMLQNEENSFAVLVVLANILACRVLMCFNKPWGPCCECAGHILIHMSCVSNFTASAMQSYQAQPLIVRTFMAHVCKTRKIKYVKKHCVELYSTWHNLTFWRMLFAFFVCRVRELDEKINTSLMLIWLLAITSYLAFRHESSLDLLISLWVWERLSVFPKMSNISWSETFGEVRKEKGEMTKSWVRKQENVHLVWSSLWWLLLLANLG